MKQQYPLYLDSREAGSLTLFDEGGALCAQALCRPLKDGLYRAYLTGALGRVLIGVLEPRGEMLCAEKRLSAGEVRALGALRGGEALRSFSFSDEHWEPSFPGRFFSDPALERRLRAQSGTLYRTEGNRRIAALPFDVHRPFPLMELFCFARLQTVEGKSRVLYAAGPDGVPVF